METVTDFIFLGSKITVDSDCSHEIKPLVPQTSRDSLEEEMATHPSILAWEIPWTVESGRLQSMGRKELDMITHTHTDSGKNYCT